MYFVKRGDHYHDVAGASFRDLLAGTLPQLPGERATVADWANHLSTIFPEVRLKRYLEMRGADSGPTGRICALPSFWVGLLYDQQSLDAAWELVKDWTAAERQSLRDDVPREGLKARIRNRAALDVARDALALADAGLARRARVNLFGDDERIHLAPLQRVVEDEATLADTLLAKFHGPWGGRVDPVFAEFAY
jgi:glutamate--cysteine ligase